MEIKNERWLKEILAEIFFRLSEMKEVIGDYNSIKDNYDDIVPRECGSLLVANSSRLNIILSDLYNGIGGKKIVLEGEEKPEEVEKELEDVSYSEGLEGPEEEEIVDPEEDKKELEKMREMWIANPTKRMLYIREFKRKKIELLNRNPEFLDLLKEEHPLVGVGRPRMAIKSKYIQKKEKDEKKIETIKDNINKTEPMENNRNGCQ